MRGQHFARLSLLTAAWFLSLTYGLKASEATNLLVQATQYTQTGGSTNFGTLSCCSWGQYSLLGGTLHCDTLQLGACGDGGTFYQTDGDFTVSTIVMTPWERAYDQGYGRLSLNGGTLEAAGILVGDSAGCDESAGVLTVDSLVLTGQVNSGPVYDEWANYASYRLTNGVLAAHSEVLSIGSFLQAGGTNALSGSLVVGGDQYFGPGRSYGSQYHLDGGLLRATNIEVGGCSVFVCGPGSSGGIENAGTFSLVGTLVITNSEHQLGALAVSQGPSPSPPTISLGSGSVLRFVDSGTQSWDTNALLTIVAWAGLVVGGGPSQLLFGTNDLALTPTQLAQIRFSNPVTLPPGTYEAMRLPTGEVVPKVVWLYATRAGGKMVLRWAGPYVLQTATDLTGPWVPVSTVDNVYTNDLSGDHGFFRLAE